MGSHHELAKQSASRAHAVRHRQPFLVQGLRQRTRLSRARYRGAGGKARASEALDDSVRSCEVARPIRVSVTRRENAPCEESWLCPTEAAGAHGRGGAQTASGLFSHLQSCMNARSGTVPLRTAPNNAERTETSGRL